MRLTKVRAQLVVAVTVLVLSVGLAQAGDSGRLLMTFHQQNRIAAYSSEGAALATAPVGVHPAGFAVREGRVYVANRGPGRAPGSSISVLEVDGLKPLETLYACENCAPTAVAFDGDGNLWFTAQNDRAAYVMEPPYEHPNGSVLLAWGWPTEIMALEGLPRLVVGMRDTTEFAVIETRERTIARQQLAPAPSQLMKRPGDPAVWVFGDTMGVVGRMAAFANDEYSDWHTFQGASSMADGTFSHDGRLLVQTSPKKNRVTLVDLKTEDLASFIEHDEAVGVIAADPHSNRFAIALPVSEKVGIFAINDEGKLYLQNSFEVQGAVKQILWLAD